MASTVRDLFLSVRVVDRATGPLRRVSQDLQRLQGTGAAGAAAQRSRLIAQNRALQLQRQVTAGELQSVTVGKQRQALNAAERYHQERILKGITKIDAIEKSQLTNQAAKIRGGIALAKAQAALALAQGGGGKITPELASKRLEAAKLTSQSIRQQEMILNRQLSQAETSLANQYVAKQKLVSAESELGARAQFLTTKMANQGEQIASNTAKIDQLAAAEKAYLSQQNLAKWSTRVRAVEHLGHALTIFGLAATAAFGLAAKGAANFATQATLAATQARPPGAPPATTARISASIQNTVLRQMQRFPASAQEMTKAIYDIFSGTNIQNIGKASQLLRIFNQEAVAGGTDLDTMVQAGITLYNNFPKQFANATTAGNKFFAMVRYGRGTAAQFAAALNPIIPIAKQAGQSFDDVSTTLAFLSRQSKDVTQNAQGYARVLLLLARPEVRAGFKRLGVDVVDNHGKIRNLLSIITELQKRVKLTPVQAITFFKTISQQATGRGTAGTIQGQRVWARLIEGAKQYRTVSKQVLADQNEFTRAFSAQRATPGVRWAIFINQLRALAIEIGTQAIPAFAKMGHYVQMAVHWFNSLSPGTKRAIGYMGAFAAVGTLVGGVLVSIVGGLASLIIMLRLMMGARGIAGLEAAATGGASGLGALGGEAGIIAPRLALIAGSISALILLFHLWPGSIHLVIGSIQGLTRALGGTQQALEFVGIFAILRKLKIVTTLFNTLGIGAIAATGRVMALRLALLRLGAIGVITIAIMLIFDSKFRGQVGDFLHGRFGFQKSIDEGLAKARNYIHRKLGPFGFLDPAVVLPSRNREMNAQLDAFSENMARRHQTAINDQFNASEHLFHTTDRKSRQQERVVGGSLVRAAVKAYRAGGSVYQKFKQITKVAEQLGVTKVTPSFQQLFENLIRTRKLANAAQRALQLSPTAANSRKALKAWENYQAALAALQNNATKQQVAAAKKVADATTTSQKAALKKQQDDFKQTIDAVQQMYDNLLQQNQQNFGQLFQGPQSALIEFRKSWGVGPTGGELLKDIKGQVFQFQRFENLLSRLRRRGAPTELIAQLQQLGPSALPEIQVLAKMMPGQWSQYLAAFKKGQSLIKSQTMKDLNSQLSLYRKFGKNVGKAIQNGIADEAPGLRNQIRQLVLKMFPALRTGHAATHAAATQHTARTPVVHHRHTHRHTHTHVHHHRHHRTPPIQTDARHRPRHTDMVINGDGGGTVATIATVTARHLRRHLPAHHQPHPVGGFRTMTIHAQTVYLNADKLIQRGPPPIAPPVNVIVTPTIPRPTTPRERTAKEEHKHTHYHDHTKLEVIKDTSLESLLAKHRNRMRNRPRYR